MREGAATSPAGQPSEALARGHALLGRQTGLSRRSPWPSDLRAVRLQESCTGSRPARVILSLSPGSLRGWPPTAETEASVRIRVLPPCYPRPPTAGEVNARSLIPSLLSETRGHCMSVLLRRLPPEVAATSSPQHWSLSHERS